MINTSLPHLLRKQGGNKTGSANTGEHTLHAEWRNHEYAFIETRIYNIRIATNNLKKDRKHRNKYFPSNLRASYNLQSAMIYRNGVMVSMYQAV